MHNLARWGREGEGGTPATLASLHILGGSQFLSSK